MSKADIIKKHKRHESDTGSPEIQIALLTERIKNLTEHLKTNKKDHHSRRGLVKLVAKRRSLLKYIKRTNQKAYEKLIKSLGLKK